MPLLPSLFDPTSRRVRSQAVWAVVGIIILLASELNPAVAKIPAARISAIAASDQMVELPGGKRMHLVCMGTGTPTVILNAGMSADHRTWAGVQPRIAKLTRVCSWDRPGYGTSDPIEEPLDAANVASKLEILLSAARIAPPYVVVGHSYGGFEALMFAHQYPDQTAAVILVESSFPHHERVFAEASPHYGVEYRKLQADRIAFARKCLSLPDVENEICMGQSKSFVRSHLSIYENWDRSSDEVETVKSLGALPLYVLTGKDNAENGAKVTAAWIGMHERYARLSTKGVHRVVDGAGHMLQDDRPDVLTDTIAQAIAASRNSNP